jgi:hypothetical protein
MPRFDLIQFIVPLTFLAIWALTSLFNREAQPLPPRTGRPPGPPGPRPGGVGSVSSPSRPSEPRLDPLGRDPGARWANPSVRRPPTRGEDDILIIESETRRTGANAGSRPGSTAPKRTARPRPTPATPERPEPPPHHVLHPVGGGLPHQMGHPLDVHIQGSTHTPLHRASQDLTKTTPSNEIPRALERPGALNFDVRTALVTPTKLREAFILNEVLGPPIALRRPSRKD